MFNAVVPAAAAVTAALAAAVALVDSANANKAYWLKAYYRANTKTEAAA